MLGFGKACQKYNSGRLSVSLEKANLKLIQSSLLPLGVFVMFVLSRYDVRYVPDKLYGEHCKFINSLITWSAKY